MKPQREQRIERLVDADPRWWVGSHDTGPRRGTGISFDCPIHAAGCRIAIPIRPPLDGGPSVHPKAWDRTGETFDALTLTPSIRVLGDEHGCEWHGFIQGGRFVHCEDSR